MPPATSTELGIKALPHPLVGKILDVQSGKLLEPAQLARTLRRALESGKKVVLGETHNRQTSGRAVAGLLRSIGAPTLREAGGIAWEMITAEKSDDLAAFLLKDDARSGKNVDGMAQAVRWDEGWGNWDAYRPIAESALNLDIPQWAAGISKSTRAKIRATAVSQLGQALTEYGFGQALPAHQIDALVEIMLRQHPIPANTEQERVALTKMLMPIYLRGVFIQQATDAYFAQVLESGPAGVLVAGQEHARQDRGAPYFLRQHGIDSVSVELIPITPKDPGDVSAYIEPSIPHNDGDCQDVVPRQYYWFIAEDPEAARREAEAVRSSKALVDRSKPQ